MNKKTSYIAGFFMLGYKKSSEQNFCMAQGRFCNLFKIRYKFKESCLRGFIRGFCYPDLVLW